MHGGASSVPTCVLCCFNVRMHDARVQPARARARSVRASKAPDGYVPRDCKARTGEEHCSSRGEPGWTGKSLKTFLYVTVALSGV